MECSDGITIQSQGSAVIVDSIVHDNTRGLVISQSGQIELTRNTICAQQTGIEVGYRSLLLTTYLLTLLVLRLFS
jgi:parallel beta-helix repeat protein